jgi:uncharacterized membrane protein YagU involved in acid resistance
MERFMMEPSSLTSSASSLPSHARRAIGWAGFVAGSLDITAALVLATREGKTPVHLFQAIAGGLLGMSSFQGGLATALLGAFFHFLIAFTAAVVFYVASRKFKSLVKYAIPSGLLYGLMVYVFMNYVVLPLSAYHVKIALPPIGELTKGMSIVMFLVGLPIALIVRKYSD